MVRKLIGEGAIAFGKKILPQNARDFLKDKGISSISDFDKMSKKELLKVLGKSTMGKKILTMLGIGGGTAGGFKFGMDVGQEKQKALDSMAKMNKGGIVAPKMGGKPSHKAKKSSKSIAKKYFKGTF
jgi:hypothetical protein|tara:strand:+ start:861 stop:1241 length:381 start_codon:yes stop_codon:yes gene_type:complete